MLLATKGLEGTSFADVLAVTGDHGGRSTITSPRQGELVHAALDLASERGLARWRPAAASRRRWSSHAISTCGAAFWTVRSLTAGCAVLAVTVAADDAGLRDHAGEIFRTWTAHVSTLLHDGGLEPTRATQLSTLLVTAVEGAMAVSRAQRSREPFDRVAETLLQLAKG